MAERKYFVAAPGFAVAFLEVSCEFEYFSGFSLAQKQRSIASFHGAIAEREPGKRILEISSKSAEPLGRELSAFCLTYRTEDGREFPVENVFQSSKVFAQGGPFRDLLEGSAKDAKRDERLRSSGELRCFEWEGRRWTLIPRSLFYDWIYLNALAQHEQLAKQLLEYDVFTDIEWNHNKSINTQARSAAIFVSLSRRGTLEESLKDPEFLKKAYGMR